MAQQFKVFAAESDDLSSVPGTHMAEGKSQLPQIVFLISTWARRCARMYTHTK